MSERINGFKVSIYPERDKATGKVVCYVGVLDLGYHADGRRNRPKRKASTKTAVREKLDTLSKELKNGIKASREDTVLKVCTDYVDLLERQGRAPSTIKNHRKQLRNQIPIIGHIKAKDLTVAHVTEWLAKIAKTLATGPLRAVHSLLSRALDYAMRLDKVGRNVSRMAELIKGEKDGRESKSFTRTQVNLIFALALTDRFAPYVILAITSGLRVDELNALTWADVEIEPGTTATVSVVRADRTTGDTKTEGSKRALQLADIAVQGLRAVRERQAREFAALGLTVSPMTAVFTREDATTYRAKTARHDFRKVLRAAGIPDADAWTTRETRHTFVSIMSDAGVPLEQIADMCGHTVKVLLKYYRRQLKPVMRQSATVINTAFGTAA